MTSEILYIAVQLLFAMLLFALVGRPLFFLFRRYVNFFKGFNIIQELVFDVYLGGLLLYAIALIPLHLFNPYLIFVLLAMCSVFTVIQLAKALRSKKLKVTFKSQWKESGPEQVIAVTLFMISLAVQVVPLAILKLGTIHDTSLYALFTELILENNQIPATHQPYLSAAIIFPQGASVIFAFTSLILGMTSPVAVFRVTTLFNALTILAAYHFGKSLDDRKFVGISFAFVFAFVSMWPLHLTWGLNAFIIGVPLFLILASFLGHLPNPKDYSKKRGVFFYVVLGLLLGYLGSLHISLFLALILGCIILATVRSIRYRKVLLESRNIIILIAMSTILIIPFIFRFVSYYNLPGQNTGLPADIVSPESSLLPMVDIRLTLQSMVDFLLNLPFQYNISPYPIARILVIALIFLVPLILIGKALKRKHFVNIEIIGCLLLAAGMILLILEPINLIPTTSLRASFILYISLMLLIGSVNVAILTGLLSKPSFAKHAKTTVLVVLVLVSFYSPLIYYRLAEDPATLTRQYALFAVTTEDDYNLMLWMRDNLPQNATILVNPFEAGLFIPALSQKIIVYPFSAYHLSASYANTTLLITEGKLNMDVFEYFENHNITYVYVGSRASSLLWILGREQTATKWDPNVFLENPNFRLAKKVGNAYLFKFALNDTQRVFEDNFDYDSLDESGWQVLQHGDGNGRVSLIKNNTLTDSNSLGLFAQSTGEPYLTAVSRRIYVPDPSNITLSIDLKVAVGLGSEDTLMLLMSNVNRDRFIRFRFTADTYREFNLSRTWEELYDEKLPESFIIEILNYDVDGIENAVFIKSIAIDANETQQTLHSTSDGLKNDTIESITGG